MKRSLILVALVLATSAQAQILNVVTSLERIDAPAHGPQTLGAAINQARIASHSRIRPMVIALDFHDDAFIIPIAGNAAGANNTFFRSDVNISNFRSVGQKIGVGWLALGTNNSSAPLQYFNVPANTTAALADFVGVTLGKTGLGGLFIEGVDSANNLDTSADLDGNSRIWTPQPGSSGTVSQNFAARSVIDLIGSGAATITGMKQNSSFRTNFGVMNLSNSAVTWTVRSAITGAQSTVTVQPFSIVQTGAPAGSGDGLGNVVLVLSSDTADTWSAWGSSTDNVTGDGWVVSGVQ